MTCGECASFMVCPVKASDEGCGKWKDWRQGMSDKCVYCGKGLIGIPSICHAGKNMCMECVDRALSVFSSIKSKDAVVIEKKDGKWPGPLYAQGKPYGCPEWGFIEQAEAWNKGVKGE